MNQFLSMLAVLKIYSKRGSEFDWKMLRLKRVRFLIHGLPIMLECIANEKEVDRNPIVYRTVRSFGAFQNFVHGKQLAHGMTPKCSEDVEYLEPQERYSHQLGSQTQYQTDPQNNESPQFKRFCKRCRNNGQSISRYFERHTNKNFPANF